MRNIEWRAAKYEARTYIKRHTNGESRISHPTVLTDPVRTNYGRISLSRRERVYHVTKTGDAICNPLQLRNGALGQLTKPGAQKLEKRRWQIPVGRIMDAYHFPDDIKFIMSPRLGIEENSISHLQMRCAILSNDEMVLSSSWPNLMYRDWRSAVDRFRLDELRTHITFQTTSLPSFHQDWICDVHFSPMRKWCTLAVDVNEFGNVVDRLRLDEIRTHITFQTTSLLSCHQDWRCDVHLSQLWNGTLRQLTHPMYWNWRGIFCLRRHSFLMSLVREGWFSISLKWWNGVPACKYVPFECYREGTFTLTWLPSHRGKSCIFYNSPKSWIGATRMLTNVIRMR